MTEVVTLPAPRQADPNLPTTPRSLVEAAVYGSSRRRRLWELHDDGLWWDTWGNPREPWKLRDVKVLPVEFQPHPDGAA